jgi:hypothetical protein
MCSFTWPAAATATTQSWAKGFGTHWCWISETRAPELLTSGKHRPMRMQHRPLRYRNYSEDDETDGIEFV